MARDGKLVNVDVGTLSCEECPMSYITPRSRWLVQILLEDKLHSDAAGACLFGPDTTLWPQWWATAVAIVQAQSLIVDSVCGTR